MINSLLFDNAAAYHNPSRDPAPSSHWFNAHLVMLKGRVGEEAEGGNSLAVSAENVADALTSPIRFNLTESHAIALSDRAIQDGFGETSFGHFYSRVPEDGLLAGPVARGALAYLVDGVVDINSAAQATGVEGLLRRVAGLDWLTKGTCNAGDIRVSFSTRSLPHKLTVVGRQGDGGVIGRHKYSNGVATVLASEGAIDLNVLVTAKAEQARWHVWWWRSCAVVCVGVGMLCGLPSEQVGGSWIASIGRAGLVLSGAATAVWWFDGGFKAAQKGAVGVLVCVIITFFLNDLLVRTSERASKTAKKA